jgi:hypothetical protein
LHKRHREVVDELVLPDSPEAEFVLKAHHIGVKTPSLVGGT